MYSTSPYYGRRYYYPHQTSSGAPGNSINTTSSGGFLPTGYDSGHSTNHSPNDDIASAVSVAANDSGTEVISREMARKLGE